MNNYKRILFLLTIILSFGCAPISDIQVLDDRTYYQELQIEKNRKEIESLKDELYNIKKENAQLKSDLLKDEKFLKEELINLKRETNGIHITLRNDFRNQIEDIKLQITKIQNGEDNLKKELNDFQKAQEEIKVKFDEDLKALKADLLHRFGALHSDVQNISTEINEYKELVKNIKKETEKFLKEIETLNKVIGSNVSNIKIFEERLKNLETININFEKYNKTVEGRLNYIEDHIKEIGKFLKNTEEYLNLIDNRIKFTENQNKSLENRLNQIAGRVDTISSKQTDFEKRIPLLKENITQENITLLQPAEIYKDAYETFKQGALEDSRKKFENFIEKFPDHELSENAQYYIAETYYLRKDFERAILEYEKMHLKYPKSDKIPTTIFKQAIAFLEIGDKANARSLFKRIIDRYPNSESAELAKKKLKELD